MKNLSSSHHINCQQPVTALPFIFHIDWGRLNGIKCICVWDVIFPQIVERNFIFIWAITSYTHVFIKKDFFFLQINLIDKSLSFRCSSIYNYNNLIVALFSILFFINFSVWLINKKSQFSCSFEKFQSRVTLSIILFVHNNSTTST